MPGKKGVALPFNLSYTDECNNVQAATFNDLAQVLGFLSENSPNSWVLSYQPN